ncbi:MAG: hypothetical protein PHG66_01015 [Candidatus Colwellbacteria bacterium]|nr:hypothetical protein [Candidatus Colwellbacteria bacterium]
MSSRDDFIRIKKFSELKTHPDINKIVHWSEFVEALNKGNPKFHSWFDTKENSKQDEMIRCGGCGHEFCLDAKTPTIIPVCFLYKYWKCDGRKSNENLCTACFYAIQNPQWNKKVISNDLSYKGEMVMNESGTWEWADRRDCGCDACERRKEEF